VFCSWKTSCGEGGWRRARKQARMVLMSGRSAPDMVLHRCRSLTNIRIHFCCYKSLPEQMVPRGQPQPVAVWYILIHHVQDHKHRPIASTNVASTHLFSEHSSTQ
jgi:hypothetical protein